MKASRPNLAQWTAARLKEMIEEGLWQDTLPGERVLSAQIGVSRPVLREALQQLEASGEIICEPNCSRKIVKKVGGMVSPEKRVLLLLDSDQQMMSDDPLLYSIVNALQRHEITPEVRPHGSVYALHRNGFFKKPTVSILLSVPQSIQKWYCLHGFPALISGSAYPGIELSSVDIDTRAVARHAVGNLLRLGHHRITCISTERPRAGDLDTEEGFREGMTMRAGTSPEVVRSGMEPHELTRHFKRILRKPSPPSALLVCHAHVAMAAASYATRIGLRIPEDLSIVCRDYSSFLQFHYPSIACYRSREEMAIRQLIRWIDAPPSRPLRKRLDAVYLPGDSVGKNMHGSQIR